MSETKKALTGVQKVAVVLMQMDQERAAQVMQQFSEIEAEEISSEIVRMRRVDAAISEGALAEFHEMTIAGKRRARGGPDIALGLLEASFGAERAAGVMGRLASTMAGKAFEFLVDVEAGQIAALLDGELPQTSALILAHLAPDKAALVLRSFPEDKHTDIAQCIATMGSATPEAVGIVAENLKLRTGAALSSRGPAEAVGGIQPLVDIISRSDVAMERTLLEAIEGRDPLLAGEIRARMLTFADLVRLERRDVQQVLRGIEPAVLAIAIKGASEELTGIVRDNISERNRDIVDDETANMGPLRMTQIEEARSEIVQSIRQLEADGTISLLRSEEDSLVH